MVFRADYILCPYIAIAVLQLPACLHSLELVVVKIRDPRAPDCVQARVTLDLEHFLILISADKLNFVHLNVPADVKLLLLESPGLLCSSAPSIPVFVALS